MEPQNNLEQLLRDLSSGQKPITADPIKSEPALVIPEPIKPVQQPAPPKEISAVQTQKVQTESTAVIRQTTNTPVSATNDKSNKNLKSKDEKTTVVAETKTVVKKKILVFPTILAAIIMALIGGYIGYKIGLRKNITSTQTATTITNVDTTPIQTQTQTTPTTTAPSSTLPAQPSPSVSQAPARVLGTNTNDRNLPIKEKTYIHSQLRIKFPVPVNWTMREVLASNYDVTFSDTQGTVATMHVDVASNQSIDQVLVGLQNNSDATNIIQINVGNITGYEYYSASSKTHIAVAAYNGNIYYLTGALVTELPRVIFF